MRLCQRFDTTSFMQSRRLKALYLTGMCVKTKIPIIAPHSSSPSSLKRSFSILKTLSSLPSASFFPCTFFVINK